MLMNKIGPALLRGAMVTKPVPGRGFESRKGIGDKAGRVVTLQYNAVILNTTRIISTREL
jgi:hypothetical protein